MPSETQNIRELIESAFDGVPRPATSLRQFLLTDQKGMSGGVTKEEWRLANITRTDAKWQDLSELEIEHCDCQLAHMQAEDFRYYLPAYMIYSIDHAQDDMLQGMIPCSVIFGLNPSRTHPEYSCSLYSLLDSAQRRAIESFLMYMADNADEYLREDSQRALKHWAEGRA